MSVGHYENFPVASVLCPPAMRPAVQAIYHFARTADDIADEGDSPAEDRRSLLLRYRAALQACAGAAGSAVANAEWPAVFGPLQLAITRHQLPLQLLDDLLDAFLQDTGNPVYGQRDALIDYCRRSANPIGRLLLHLAGVDDPVRLAQSDAVCSALQLINFWQDLGTDVQRGRHYVPLVDAARYGLNPTLLRPGQDSPASQALLRELCHWAAELMMQGAPLVHALPGRLGWELRLVVQGGLRILERIGAMNYLALSHRPVLRASDTPVLLWRALCMRPGRVATGFGLA